MNARQRFLETMQYGLSDRAPLFREGMREDVIQAWLKQGLTSEETLFQTFHFDQRQEVKPDLYPREPILQGSSSLADLERIRQDLHPDDPSRLPEDWDQILRLPDDYEHVRMLKVHEGFFLSMGVGDWKSFMPVMLLLKANPRLVQEILAITAAFCAAMADLILGQIQVDAVIIGEPISGPHGPLISPSMYAELILPSYAPVLDVVQAHGVEVIIWRTYANSKALLPAVLQTRINCLWAAESNIQAMDYRRLRERYGKQLRLIGGIDTDAILAGPAAIRSELAIKLPPLLRQGGYCPMADGRIREYVSFEHYAHYRQMLESYVRIDSPSTKNR